MPRKRNNPVSLSREDRDMLEGLIAHGRAPARELSHARILLKADEAADRRLARREDRRRPGGEPLDGFPCAREVRLGGLGGCPPSPAERRQAQEARWRAGGPFDRTGLLRAAEGQKEMERRAFGRAVG